jgi:hypothetical protein
METNTALSTSQAWFRIETRIPGVRETFVDWFSAATLRDALALALAEAKANALPNDIQQTGRIATLAEARAL